MNELINKVEQWSLAKGLDKDDSNERFAIVEGFPHHVIMNDGRVFIMSYIDLNGRKRKAKEVKQHLDTDGYPSVKLTYFGKKLTTRVHRLVAEAFIPKVENKETVNHKDGNKENNHFSNLEWADRAEQLQHAYDLGLKKPTAVSKLLTKTSNSNPVKCYNKETNETTYHLSARDCSKDMGYSERWCDKTISSSNGETAKFKLEYVTLNELKANSDKVNLSTLIRLVELWSFEKNLHKADPAKQALKFFEEAGETAAALARSNMDALRDGIGDVIVTLIILAQQKGYTLDECLQYAYDEIKGRTGEMVDGVFVKSADL